METKQNDKSNEFQELKGVKVSVENVIERLKEWSLNGYGEYVKMFNFFMDEFANYIDEIETISYYYDRGLFVKAKLKDSVEADSYYLFIIALYMDGFLAEVGYYIIYKDYKNLYFAKSGQFEKFSDKIHKFSCDINDINEFKIGDYYILVAEL